MKTIGFIAMLCFSCVVQAHVFCVYEEDDTGDAACAGYCGLIQALAAASSAGTYSGEDNYIQVAVGTYHTHGLPFGFISNANPGHILDISGGYSQDCSSQRQDPHLTVINGDAIDRALRLDNQYGPIGVRWLTIQNGTANTAGGGCEINGLIDAPGGEVNFNYNVVRNNTSSFAGGGCYIRSGITLRMFSNLFKGNNAALYGAVEVASNGTLAHLYNNTVTENTSTTPAQNGALSCGGSTNAQIANNIFYGNTGGDIWLFSPATVMNNDYDVYGGDMPAPGTAGNIDIDPLFIAPDNLRVLNGSPTIMAGVVAVPDGLPTIDILGFPRTYGGFVDIGAYSHDEIFTNDFESQ